MGFDTNNSPAVKFVQMTNILVCFQVQQSICDMTVMFILIWFNNKAIWFAVWKEEIHLSSNLTANVRPLNIEYMLFS